MRLPDCCCGLGPVHLARSHDLPFLTKNYFMMAVLLFDAMKKLSEFELDAFTGRSESDRI